MTDTTTHNHAGHDHAEPGRARLDRVWLAIPLLLLAVALLRPGDVAGIATAAAGSLAGTLPFIAFAVLAVAYLKASGGERLIAGVFTGSPTRMIVAAALMGGLAPFCSCEVIPFIAAMLALGAPLAAVMAFWLASPLMDPAMFFVTAGALGMPFALAKLTAAVGLGLFGGFATRALGKSGLFADPLRGDAAPASCCAAKKPFAGAPRWRFWDQAERRAAFAETARSNALFLIKWLALAYVIEAMMVAYVPAAWVGGLLGGEGLQPIVLGALLGGPAYLNGYAAVPLVSGLLEQGMNPGAAMSFLLAGGVSCVPAAMAVWALVKPRVFAAYVGFAFTGSLIAGLTWAALAG